MPSGKQTRIISIIDPRHRDPKPSWDPPVSAARAKFIRELILVVAVALLACWGARLLGTY
jgi:hypothetical protein